jgi:pilus assembly protein CpaC
MRSAVLAGVLLGCVTPATGQAVPRGRAHAPVAESATISAEARYLELAERASRLDAAGRTQEAETVRRQADRQRQALREHLDRLQAEVDRLRKLIGASPQVLVQIRMMEFSRTKLRALGFDLAKIEGEEPAGHRGEKTVGAYRVRVIDDARPLLGVIDAMQKDKLLRVLAEPTLAADSGQPAVYHVGGEFPILTPTKGGEAAVEYKQYGTRVDMTATVLGRHTIRLHVRARQSEIDPRLAVRDAGVTVPSLRARDVDTGTEMQSGQTLVISGLVQTRTRSVRRKPAVVGSVPGVGNLLTKTEEEHEEIEMIVLVTPQIVPPAAAAQAARPRRPPSAPTPMGLQYDLRQ